MIAVDLNRHNKSYTNALKYAKAYSDFFENRDYEKENFVTCLLMTVAGIYANPFVQNIDSSNYYLNKAYFSEGQPKGRVRNVGAKLTLFEGRYFL